MYCSGCGRQLRESAAFCSGCGRRVISVSQQANLEHPPAKKKTGRVIVCLFVFLALVAILASVSSHTNTDTTASSSQSTSQSGAPPAEDALTAKQHLSELRKLVSKHPLLEPDIASIRKHIIQLQLKKADADKTTAEIIAIAENRLKWAEWRNKVSFEATVTCRMATQARLKAPDSVEWKGQDGGWDPEKDWYYNIDLEADAMNSFGAKLRSVFYCQVLCSDKELPNGSHCVAVSVREQ
jgi:hypothetical protein